MCLVLTIADDYVLIEESIMQNLPFSLSVIMTASISIIQPMLSAAV